MGERGAVPKRSDERRRRNKPETPITTAPSAPNVTAPDPAEDWHPIARYWFESLGESGQAIYYQPSDWATAYYVAEAMSRNLYQGGKFSSMLFTGVMSAMTELLTTEGSRRRVRLEIDRNNNGDEDEDASVTALADYRKTLGAA